MQYNLRCLRTGAGICVYLLKTIRPDSSTNMIQRGFFFQGVFIDSEAINMVKRCNWLEAEHIRFFCLYMQAIIAEVQPPWKVYFFGPLQPRFLEEGWDRIYNMENLGSAKDLLCYDFLVFPVATDENDHWFMIIIAHFKDLCCGGHGEVSILDSKCNDWKELHKPMIKLIHQAAEAANAEHFKSSNIQFYQAFPGLLPQQKKDLCGFYLMAYIEIFVRDPNILLNKIRKRKNRQGLKHGKLDRILPERFLRLLEDFRDGFWEGGCLMNRIGQPIIKASLHGVLTDP